MIVVTARVSNWGNTQTKEDKCCTSVLQEMEDNDCEKGGEKAKCGNELALLKCLQSNIATL